MEQGLMPKAAKRTTSAFALTPASIYFEHLYLYDYPVAMLLAVNAALFHRGVSQPSVGAWLAFGLGSFGDTVASLLSGIGRQNEGRYRAILGRTPAAAKGRWRPEGRK